MISSLKQTFVRFMRGRHPQTILTDLDPGLGEAIAKELSETKHVISMWHILSKISNWFYQIGIFPYAMLEVIL